MPQKIEREAWKEEPHRKAVAQRYREADVLPAPQLFWEVATFSAAGAGRSPHVRRQLRSALLCLATLEDVYRAPIPGDVPWLQRFCHCKSDDQLAGYLATLLEEGHIERVGLGSVRVTRPWYTDEAAWLLARAQLTRDGQDGRRRPPSGALGRLRHEQAQARAGSRGKIFRPFAPQGEARFER